MNKNIIPPGKISAPEPIKREFGGKIYVRVNIVLEKHNTGKAALVQLKAGQIINGCKVKSGQDTWIPNHLHLDATSYADGKGIWVLKEFYDKMRFV